VRERERIGQVIWREEVRRRERGREVRKGREGGREISDTNVTRSVGHSTRESLLKGKAQYSRPPHKDRLFCKKKCSVSLKSNLYELASARRSTVLIFPFQ